MKRTKIIYISLAVFISVIVVMAFWSCRRPASSEPFRVGIATYPGFAPGFIAKEKGFFGDLPVEFSILDDFTARQNAFTSGNTHATISTLDSYAFESGQGVDGRVVMILDESYGADAIVVSSAIQSAQDLRGKKIAYTRGSPSHFFLIQYLGRHGLTVNDISRVEVDDPSRAGEAFISGSVDAAVTWEPNITQIVNSGRGRVLESTRTSPGLIFDIMVVSPTVYERRRSDIQTFVDGWLRAIEYIKANSHESYSIMARSLSIPENEFPQMAQALRYADIGRNREMLLPPGNNRAVQIFNEATRVWVEERLVSTPRPGEQLIVSEFILNHR